MWYLISVLLVIVGGILLKRKIKIPSKEEQRIEVLEVENADLWFENLTLQAKVNTHEQEIADLWYQSLTGGEI